MPPAAPPAPPPPPGWGPPPTNYPPWSEPAAPSTPVAPAMPAPTAPTAPPSWGPASPSGMAGRSPIAAFERPESMQLLARLAKLVGFALLFVGALVVVLGASVPGGCFASGANCSNTGTNYAGTAATSIIVGKALAVFGAAGIGLGGMMTMRYALPAPAGAPREQFDFVIASRRHNGWLVLFAIALLLLLLLSVNSWPVIAAPP